MPTTIRVYEDQRVVFEGETGPEFADGVRIEEAEYDPAFGNPPEGLAPEDLIFGVATVRKGGFRGRWLVYKRRQRGRARWTPRVKLS